MESWVGVRWKMDEDGSARYNLIARYNLSARWSGVEDRWSSVGVALKKNQNEKYEKRVYLMYFPYFHGFFIKHNIMIVN